MNLSVINKVKRLKAIKAARVEAQQQALMEQARSEQQKERPVEPVIPTFEEFASTLYIRSGSKLIPFSELYGYQQAIAKLNEVYPGLVIVKDRQLGISELIIAIMLWKATYNPAYVGASFSISDADAKKLSKRAEFMPSRIEGFKWAIDSLGIRSPQGGGELNFRPSTDNATRGLASVHDLFFDEAGFVRIIGEMYAASSPSQEMVGAAARTFVVSTIPSAGTDCWFWGRVMADNPEWVNIEQMLALARSGGHLNRTKIELPEIPGLIAFEDESGWCKLIIGHKAHPIYGADPDYVETVRRKKKLTIEQAHREHNLTLPSKRSDNPLINYFDETKHVKDVEIDPLLPLYLSFDFNRHPATCLLGNVVDDRLVFLEEFYLLNSDTFKLAKAVADRVESISPFRLLITGDASGKINTANSQKSNWDIVREEFESRELMFVRKWREGNPPIVDTVNSLNYLFMEDRAIVSPRCAEFIKDLKQCEDDGKGGINKKKDKMRTHLFDTGRYLAYLVFPYKSAPNVDWMLD